MNNDIQWSTSQSVIDVESYNDNDNDNDRNPIIGPRDWSATETVAGFQAKFDIVTNGVAISVKP